MELPVKRRNLPRNPFNTLLDQPLRAPCIEWSSVEHLRLCRNHAAPENKDVLLKVAVPILINGMVAHSNEKSCADTISVYAIRGISA